MGQPHETAFPSCSTADVGPNKSLLTVLCTAGWLAESLGSTHWMPIEHL